MIKHGSHRLQSEKMAYAVITYLRNGRWVNLKILCLMILRKDGLASVKINKNLIIGEPG